jgi:hypothetical protein
MRCCPGTWSHSSHHFGSPPERDHNVNRLLIIGACALAGAVLIYVTAYLARCPEPKCETTSVSAHWAPDRAYKATLLKKSCNLDETLFYSVRIDAYSPPLERAWFVPGYELENDTYPDPAPNLRWSSPRQLEVVVATRTMAGTVTLHTGEDLTFVRTYAPREPSAFPNY